MNPDFVDLLRALLAADATLMVVGAYAVGVHGRPRATKDLAPRRHPAQVTGPAFADAWGGRVSAEFAPGVSVPVIGLDALLENKRAAGRPQDLADVAALERLRRLRAKG